MTQFSQYSRRTPHPQPKPYQPPTHPSPERPTSHTLIVHFETPTKVITSSHTPTVLVETPTKAITPSPTPTALVEAPTPAIKSSPMMSAPKLKDPYNMLDVARARHQLRLRHRDTYKDGESISYEGLGRYPDLFSSFSESWQTFLILFSMVKLVIHRYCWFMLSDDSSWSQCDRDVYHFETKILALEFFYWTSPYMVLTYVLSAFVMITGHIIKCLVLEGYIIFQPAMVILYDEVLMVVSTIFWTLMLLCFGNIIIVCSILAHLYPYKLDLHNYP